MIKDRDCTLLQSEYFKVPDFHAKFFLKNNNATKFGEIGLTEN